MRFYRSLQKFASMNHLRQERKFNRLWISDVPRGTAARDEVRVAHAHGSKRLIKVEHFVTQLGKIVI